MRRAQEWLQPTGAYLWRLLSGMPPGGGPRTGAGWSAPSRRTLPQDTAPRQPTNPLAEILWDFREIRAEWRQLRVRRALGRELANVERQVLAEQDPGES
jgi:hypothetical protein